jgi:hypothetical protein
MGAYYPMQDPSGSSSGPGVVSSIGLAAAAVGTETSGSIISPSSRNSLTGIKPVCPHVCLDLWIYTYWNILVCRVDQQIPCCTDLADPGYRWALDANNDGCSIHPICDCRRVCFRCASNLLV